MKKFFLIVSIILLSASAFAATVSVKNFGAAGDGKTDDTKAFKDALQSVAADGGIVNVPAGKYCLRGNLSVPAGVTLQGEWNSAPIVLKGENEPSNTVLMAYAGRGDASAEPFIRMNTCSSLRGVAIYYPEHSVKDVPPVPYPPCIYAERTDNVEIENVNIENAYDGVVLKKSGRFYVDNLQGYPIHTGFKVDGCYDIGRIENVHFWPFGIFYTGLDPYCKWINENGTAFEFNRTDWQYCTNCFCFGYGVGYKFKNDGDGSPNGSFVAIGADSCNISVLVEDTDFTGISIIHGEFTGSWGNNTSKGIVIKSGKGAEKSKISVVNTAFWGPLVSCVECDNPIASLTLSACRFCEWDRNCDAAPAVDLIRGRAVITGNTFDENYRDIRIGKAMGSVVISSNISEGGLKVTNNSGRFVNLTDNEPAPAPMNITEKKHYILNVGMPGDTPYLENFYKQEPATGIGGGFVKPAEQTKGQRWTHTGAAVKLPVIAGRKYRLRMQAGIREGSLCDGAGFYLGGKRLISVTKAGEQYFECDVTPESDVLRLDVKSGAWSPANPNEKQPDLRTLGLLVRSIEMTADGCEKLPAAAANRKCY